MEGAEDRGYRTGRHVFVLHPCRREGGAHSNLLAEEMHLPLPWQSDDNGTKSPASEGGGADDRKDQSPLRRDQIRVKPSSPSILTSEA